MYVGAAVNVASFVIKSGLETGLKMFGRELASSGFLLLFLLAEALRLKLQDYSSIILSL